jgi:hypothetical protein
MTPLVIGALLAVAAMVWVIAPIFSDASRDVALEKNRDGQPPSQAADDAAEEAIRKWRQPQQ